MEDYMELFILESSQEGEKNRMSNGMIILSKNYQERDVYQKIQLMFKY